MKNLMLICMVLISNLVLSQEIDSIYGMGSSGNEHLKAIHRDQDGNIYMLQYVGTNSTSFFGTAVHYNFPGSGSNQWLAKIDSNYNLLWDLPIHGSNYNAYAKNPITTDQEGNIYFTNSWPRFTYKMSADGEIIWESPIGANNISYDKARNSIDLFDVYTLQDSIMGEYIEDGGSTVISLDSENGAYGNHFFLDLDEFPETIIMGKNEHGYYGVRRKPLPMGTSEHVELFLCDDNGLILQNKFLNRTGHYINLIYNEELQEYFANGLMLSNEPLNNPITNSSVVSNYIVQLDNSFRIKRSLRLSDRGSIYTNAPLFHLHAHGENIYLSGKIIREFAFSHLGQEVYLDAKEDNVVFAKLDRTLRPVWHKILETTYFAGRFPFFFASENQIFFPGSTSGQNGGPNNPFPVAAGSSDVYVVAMSDKKAETAFVQGKIFVDANQNGIDDNEIGYGYHQVTSDQNGSRQYVFDDGGFEFSAAPGQTTLRAITEKPYIENTTPDSILVNVQDMDSLISGQNFGIYIKPNIKDIAVNINALTPCRPGFDVQYDISFRNDGSATLQGEIRLILDENLSYVNASIIPDSIESNILVWNYDDFAPNENRHILLTVNLAPIVGLIGTFAHSTIEITPLVTDTFPNNNRDTLLTEITGSYDPNDIDVYPKCIDFTESSDPILNYKIRFQNTGNDTAFTVLIKDDLSELIEPSSVRFNTSSHPVKTEVKGTELRFLFEDILLPDSIVDLSGSNGFVDFSVRLKSGFTSGDVITNKAAIFFDFNPPIITNEINTSFFEGPVSSDTVVINTCPYYIMEAGDTITVSGIYENLYFTDLGCPIREIIDLNIDPINTEIMTDGETLSVNGPEGSAYQWLDCDLDFSPIIGANQSFFEGEIGGSYALELTFENCTDTSECVNIMPLNTEAEPESFKIYPNPFNSWITIAGNLNSILDVEVQTIQGQSVRNYSIERDQNIHLVFDNELASGIYLLKIKTADGWRNKMIVTE